MKGVFLTTREFIEKVVDLLDPHFMATSRTKKEEIVKFLQDSVVVQKAVVLFGTKDVKDSLNAEKNQSFRHEANAQGLVIKVVKNTIIKKLFPSVPELSGQTYLAFLGNPAQSDEITTPKGIVGLVDKEFKDNFEIIGAIVNDEYLDKNSTIKLSSTPSKQDSMGMAAGAIKQIIAKLAMTINEIPSSVARGVEAVSSKKA